MPTRSNSRVALICALGFVLSASAARAQTFRGLCDLPGGSFESLALGVSADRSTVVGRCAVAGACNGQLSVNWNAYVAATPSALGAPFAAGDVVYLQGWFRDPPSVKTTALSNALSVVLCP